MHRIAQHLAHLPGAFKQLFFLEEVQGCNGRRTSHRMAGVGVAMGELDRVLGRVLVGLHQTVVNTVRADHAAQRNHAIGHALGKVQHVRHHAVIVSTKVAAQAPKTGDDLVKNQQNAVSGADLAQSLQIAFRRQIPARTASHGLDNDGRDVARVMQRQDAIFQLQQEVFIPLGLGAVDVSVFDRVVNETHVVHTRQQSRTKHFAVGGNAAHAHAAEANPVVAALAAYKHIAMAFAARAVVSQCHF